MIFVGRGFLTTSTGGGGGGVGVGGATAVEARFFDEDGVDCDWEGASEARLFDAGSRRSRAESLRFSAIRQ